MAHTFLCTRHQHARERQGTLKASEARPRCALVVCFQAARSIWRADSESWLVITLQKCHVRPAWSCDIQLHTPTRDAAGGAAVRRPAVNPHAAVTAPPMQ
jgi:hypothetical protein